MKTMNKIVVKVGTSTLTQGGQKLSRRTMLGLVEQVVHLQSLGKEILIVSSGAVAAGREFINGSTPTKPLFASVGQVRLMQAWAELFSLFDLYVGQVLLTRDDFSLHARTRETLEGLLSHRIIPVINENDAMATHENRIGDNDNLAALVANLVKADALILLTDQEGLYTADPRLDPAAKLISLVKSIDDAIYALAGSTSSSVGTGGMATKIAAVQVAAKTGVRTIIASSLRPNVLIDIAEGKSVGTLFMKEASV